MNFEEILRNLNEKAKEFSTDNEKVSKLVEDAKEKIENNELFSSISEDIKETIEMLVAWKDGEYTELSRNSVGLIIGGLIYIVNPLGIVPKFLTKIPLGQVLVMTYILKIIKDELELYRVWKSENKVNVDDSDGTIYIKL